jgi:hypothetical protein
VTPDAAAEAGSDVLVTVIPDSAPDVTVTPDAAEDVVTAIDVLIATDLEPDSGSTVDGGGSDI